MARFMFATYSSRTARHNVSSASVNNFIGIRERNKTDRGEMRLPYSDEFCINPWRRTSPEKDYSE